MNQTQQQILERLRIWTKQQTREFLEQRRAALETLEPIGAYRFAELDAIQIELAKRDLSAPAPSFDRAEEHMDLDS